MYVINCWKINGKQGYFIEKAIELQNKPLDLQLVSFFFLSSSSLHH